MLASDVITRTRLILQDTSSEAYRWTDTTIFYWINNGVREIRKRRTDAQLDSDAEMIDYESVTASSDELVIADDFEDTLVNYLCYRCLSQDADNKNNMERAKFHYTMYEKGLTI